MSEAFPIIVKTEKWLRQRSEVRRRKNQNPANHCHKTKTIMSSKNEFCFEDKRIFIAFAISPFFLVFFFFSIEFEWKSFTFEPIYKVLRAFKKVLFKFCFSLFLLKQILWGNLNLRELFNCSEGSSIPGVIFFIFLYFYK